MGSYRYGTHSMYIWSLEEQELTVCPGTVLYLQNNWKTYTPTASLPSPPPHHTPNKGNFSITTVALKYVQYRYIRNGLQKIWYLKYLFFEKSSPLLNCETFLKGISQTGPYGYWVDRYGKVWQIYNVENLHFQHSNNNAAISTLNGQCIRVSG